MTRPEADPAASYSTSDPLQSSRTGKPARRARRPWGRRRVLPGWIFLVLILLGFYVVISQTWSYDSRDVTIDAWACRQSIPDEAASSASPARGDCAPARVPGEIGIYQLVSPLGGGVGQDPLTVPRVDVDSRELNLQVRLQDPAASVVLVEADSSGGGVAMSGDKARVRWNAPFRLGEGTEFLLLVGPPPQTG